MKFFSKTLLCPKSAGAILFAGGLILFGGVACNRERATHELPEDVQPLAGEGAPLDAPISRDSEIGDEKSEKAESPIQETSPIEPVQANGSDAPEADPASDTEQLAMKTSNLLGGGAEAGEVGSISESAASEAPANLATTAELPSENPGEPDPGGAADASPEGAVSDGEYQIVSFDTLAGYEYMIPTLVTDAAAREQLKDQIPDNILVLNEKKVSIDGYMVPIDVDGEKIKSFILTNSVMMCCFGVMPWINEWIFVEMPEGKEADFYDNVVISVKGKLEVGEEIEDGIVVSLYRMDGHEVASTGEPMKFLFNEY